MILMEVILCTNYTFTEQIRMSKRVRTKSSISESDSENETSYEKKSFKVSSLKSVVCVGNTDFLFHEDQKEKALYNLESSASNVLSQSNLTPAVNTSHFSYENDMVYDKDSYKRSSASVLSHINSTPTLKKSYSSNEDDKFYNRDSYKNVDVSERTLIRGKRSLPAKDKFSIESPSRIFNNQYERKSYPFQDSYSSQSSSTSSYLSKSASYQSPSLTFDDQYRRKSYPTQDSHSPQISSNSSYSRSVSFQTKESPSKTFDNQYRRKSYSSRNSPQHSSSHSYINQYATDQSKESPTGTIDNHYRRKSYPFQDCHTPQLSSSRSYSKCATDQTPYSPVSSNRRVKRFRTALPYYNPSDLITFRSDEGFIDSHCHLDFLFQRQGYENSYLEFQKKHKNTFPDCYKGCLAIFCNPETFGKKYLWESYLEEENVWASFGCHPHNAKDYDDKVEHSLKSALKHSKVRALGEIGLDYSSRNYCMKELQHEAFERQIKIALDMKLPLVIHCREAHDDGMTIMKKLVPKDYFIHLHCFTDKWEIASKWLHEFPNLFIGITNVVTFPSAEDVHEVAKNIPLTKLLLETDAPYFIPRPLQREFPETKYSHPGMAIHVAAQVAALKNMPLEVVLHATRKNTKIMYKI